MRCNSVDALCSRALSILREYNLGPRDAFHFATASEAGIGAISTTDGDFDRMPSVTILKIA